MNEEALALADYLDNNVDAMYLQEQPYVDKASEMIRKLVKELDRYHMAWNMAENEIEKLKEELACANDYIKQYQLEQKLHLSNEGFLIDDVKRKGGL